ncbi:MAG: hypothetical protein AB1397_02100 [bacterium]
MKKIEPSPFSQAPKLKVGLQMKAKLAADLLSLSEAEFADYVRRLEDDPLFGELLELGIIRYRRFPRTFSVMELRPELISDSPAKSPEPLLSEREDTIKLIRQIGKEDFCRFFLYNDGQISLENIKKELSLSLSQIKAINQLITDFEVQYGVWYQPKDRGGYISYTKIASIQDDLTIGFFWQNMTRGKYIIEYERLKEEGFDKAKISQIKRLLRKLELANTRKTLIFQILEKIVEQQAKYLKNGRLSDLSLLTETEVAQDLGVAISSVSRAIQNRCVETPWGERPLKFFFFSSKDRLKLLVEKIIEEEKTPLTDGKIQQSLKKYGISVARRTVAQCRKELKILSFRRR